MKFKSDKFREIWAFDFEFHSKPGNHPNPVCLVAWELKSGRRLKVWQTELNQMKEAPYSTDNDSLFIAYYASAEISCHLVLNWPIPVNILDLYVEFRNLTNGKQLQTGSGLVGALNWYGYSGLDALKKDAMRDLIIDGGPWSPEEQTEILDYCESDVQALTLLSKEMAPHLDIPRALIRGRFMAAAAKIEHHGIPIDLQYLRLLKENWDPIKKNLISKVDANYELYDGQSFRSAKFAEWLAKKGIPWPHLESGALDLKDNTFREMARIYAEIAPFRELRVALSQMRLSNLTIGDDGRNRCLLSAFQARTGRNAPSNSKFIFGPSVWLRGLIKPEPGMSLAVVDWSQQEFGIAAALSGDDLMMKAYRSGDPYLEFGKQAGLIPESATKKSHNEERQQFKACVLGINYGMTERGLALRIRKPVSVARELIRQHKKTYPYFWQWSDGAIDYAMLHGKLWATFGWTIHVADEKPNPRMLRNFLLQANAAEMLRLACCLILDRGINICAPIHDAVLIEAPLNEIEEKIKLSQNTMAEASRIVLNGFELNSDAKVIGYPDRYMDERGKKMWNNIDDILKNLSRQ
jgi:hypothetical protein